MTWSQIKQTKLYLLMKKMKIVDFVWFLIMKARKFNELIKYYILLPLLDRLHSLKINLLLLRILLTKTPELGITSGLEKRSTQLIISLTSYPLRMKYIHITLYSLLTQNLKPDKVILWLGEDEFNNKKINNWKIQVLEKIGLTVSWVPENIKAYTKLLPALMQYPQDCIITADDDAIYEKWWTQKLYLGHLETPTCIVGLRAMFLSKSSNNKLKSFYTCAGETLNDYKHKQFEKHIVPNNNSFLEGCAGVLFPPNSFSKEVFNKAVFQRICPYADDIWFCAMAILHNTKRRLLLNESIFNYSPRMIVLGQQKALYKINLDQNYNDVQFMQVFDYYDLYKMIE